MLAVMLVARVTIGCEAAMAASMPSAVHGADMSGCHEDVPDPGHPAAKAPCVAVCSVLPSVGIADVDRVAFAERALPATIEDLLGATLRPAVPPPRWG
jgi:hypothetical protein